MSDDGDNSDGRSFYRFLNKKIMNKLANLILTLLDTAEVLGLDETSLSNAKSFFDNNEYGLAFDVIITQLYECEIEIDHEAYSLIERTAKRMKISEKEYSFMIELIRDKKEK